MKVIHRGRRQGKTTELIRMSADTGAYIVTTDHRDAYRIAMEAESHGLSIPFPITTDEFRYGRYSRRLRGLLIDNAEMVLQDICPAVPVLAMSISGGESPLSDAERALMVFGAWMVQWAHKCQDEPTREAMLLFGQASGVCVESPGVGRLAPGIPDTVQRLLTPGEA